MRKSSSLVLSWLEDSLQDAISKALSKTDCSTCSNPVQFSKELAQAVTDYISVDWGGQSLYFSNDLLTADNSERTRNSISYKNSKLFLQLLDEEVHRLFESNFNSKVYGQCKVSSALADLLFREIKRHITTSFLKTQVYIPFDRTRMPRIIYSQFTGDNTCELARRFRVATQQIYRMIRDYRNQQKHSTKQDV